MSQRCLLRLRLSNAYVEEITSTKNEVGGERINSNYVMQVVESPYCRNTESIANNEEDLEQGRKALRNENKCEMRKKVMPIEKTVNYRPIRIQVDGI